MEKAGNVNLVPRTTIQHAYGTLTQREYEIWYAHHVDGHSTRHIAAALHITQQAVHNTLKRAGKRLT